MSPTRVGLIAAHLVVALGVASCSSSDGSSTPVESGPPASTRVESVPVTAAVVAPEPDESAAAAGTSDEQAGADEALGIVIADFVGGTDGGAEVLIERDGVVRRAAAGVGSSDGEALEVGRSFRVGSLSKPFISVMVQQLAEESVVDLDAPLGNYLPDTTVGADATIRQLLSHQSGIPNYTDQTEFFGEVLADLNRQVPPAEVLTYIDGVESGPVDRFAYSNTNYILLGQLIEHLDGADLNASLQARVTGPLGLEATYFDTGVEPLPSDLAGGWSSLGVAGDPAAPYDAITSSAWAAGALVSTAADLARFLHGVASGQMISPESLAAMTDFGTAGYGLGVNRAFLSPISEGFGHGGSIPGYSTTMAVDPQSGDTLVVLTTNDALIADELALAVLTAG